MCRSTSLIASREDSGVSEPAFIPPARARARRVRDRLREIYGIPTAPPHGWPLDELILTVLSQSTNDRNRDAAFLRLRERFPDGPDGRVSWPAVRDVPRAEVEEAIRPGGISKVKSARIQAILVGIGEPLSLDWMREAPVAFSRATLCALPGVGRKTAACVLLFSFGLREVPVDTHVARVGARLGLLRPGAPFEELHDAMLKLTAPGEELELHLNLLRHGRRTCTARSPQCHACDLLRMCPRVGLG
jgi:endonuclease III